jgi:hypothetical protein
MGRVTILYTFQVFHVSGATVRMGNISEFSHLGFNLTDLFAEGRKCSETVTRRHRGRTVRSVWVLPQWEALWVIELRAHLRSIIGNATSLS